MAKSDTPATSKFVDAAYTLFAERGFYGVSLADVAAEVGLTKQAIIYHFRTKEALYSAVLQRRAAELQRIIDQAKTEGTHPEACFGRYLQLLFTHMMSHPADARLIMRELLDNGERLHPGSVWHLRDFLDQSTAMLQAVPGWRTRSEAACSTALYQMLGAMNYFAISDETISGIWGEERFQAMADLFLKSLGDIFPTAGPIAGPDASPDAGCGAGHVSTGAARSL